MKGPVNRLGSLSDKLKISADIEEKSIFERRGQREAKSSAHARVLILLFDLRSGPSTSFRVLLTSCSSDSLGYCLQGTQTVCGGCRRDLRPGTLCFGTSCSSLLSPLRVKLGYNTPWLPPNQQWNGLKPPSQLDRSCPPCSNKNQARAPPSLVFSYRPPRTRISIGDEIPLAELPPVVTAIPSKEESALIGAKRGEASLLHAAARGKEQEE